MGGGPREAHEKRAFKLSTQKICRIFKFENLRRLSVSSRPIYLSRIDSIGPTDRRAAAAHAGGGDAPLLVKRS